MGAAVGLTLLSLHGGPTAQRAAADTSPPTGVPATVSSDPLPTAQINGVVWSQVMVGNIVYAGGNFTRARPAGAAAGTQEVVRNNLVAYNVTTGVMTSFAPNVNGQVQGVTASPDGSTLYAVGQFTQVNGQNRYRVAAFNTATGALTSFAPVVNSTIYGAAATASTLYIGGNFTSVNGSTRQAAAGLNASNGVVTSFAPATAGGSVRQVVVSPDATKVVVGGNFTSMNGSTNPGYGLAMLNATNGSSLAMPVNSVIRNAGSNSAIYSLAGNANGFYGAGYVYSQSGGNLEGAFKADWNGNLQWIQDCHGDTYSVFPAGSDVYIAGHPHYCGNVGGFPQTEPRANWTYQRGLAFSDDVRGTITRDPYGYFNFEGRPRPALLHWLPDLNTGTFTGQTQGPWSVSANSDYVVYGGEFTRVNNVGQQGLVRYARTSLAPNTDGPRLGTSQFVPTATNFAQGIRLSWPANWDRDNELLSYDLIKNGNLANPVFTRSARSSWWQRPYLAFLDTSVTPGQSYSYRLRATDPKGNVSYGDTISVTASGGSSLSSYDEEALSDGPRSYWPFNETSGSTAADVNGVDPGTRTSGVTQGVPGAIAGQPGTAYRFPGNSGGFVSTTGTARRAPQIFSVESWIKTTTTSGGKLIGFGNRSTGNSTSYDRHLYMGNTGRLYFGVNPDARTIGSPGSYNDGQWHHVVATLSSAGLYLYVDGAQVAGNPAITYANWISDGYWRIGGDALGNWPGSAGGSYFSGDIDDPAIYLTALTPAQVQAHYAARTGATPNESPTAAFTAETDDLAATFDGGSSSDPDGNVVSYAWQFGDGGTGSGETPSHNYAAGGTFPVTLTVTDNDGGTDSVTQNVTVTEPDPPDPGEPFVSDLFNRAQSTGLGSADVGGAWTVSDPAGFAVVSGSGQWRLTSPGVTRSANLGGTLRSSTDLTMNLSVDKNAVGGTTYAYVEGRRVTSNTEYRSVFRFSTSNTVSVGLEALKGSTTATVLANPITVGTLSPGTEIHVRMQTFGTNPTTIRTKVWLGAASEPAAWTVSASDSYAALQTNGAVGLITYISGAASNTPVTFSVSDIEARPVE